MNPRILNNSTARHEKIPSMEFRKYLRQGIWGLADKALPVVYGIGYVLLVIRVLPEEEFGLFVLVQEIFLIISGLATAFALQPLLKFGSEDRTEQAGLQTSAGVLHALFLLITSIAIVALRNPVSSALQAPGLAPLLVYVPAMLAASFIRNTSLTLLQSRFLIQQVFWVDSVHFLGVPFFVWVVSRLHLFDSALDLILINVVTLSASSLLGLFLSRRLISLTLALRWSDWQRLISYGLYSLGGMASYFTSTKADTFVLSAFFGPVQVALYNAAKVFTRIFDMATQVIQMLVLPASSRLSSRGDDPSLKDLVEKSLLFATLGMVPVCAVMLAAPEPLLALIYGGRYADAATLLRIISPMALVVPVLAIGSSVLMGLGEARAGFVLSVQTLVVSLAAYYLLVPSWGTVGAAWGFVLAAFIMTVITVVFLRRFVTVTARGVLGRMRDISAFVRQQAGLLRGKI
jgi:lipopolysaccharide exporter